MNFYTTTTDGGNHVNVWTNFEKVKAVMEAAKVLGKECEMEEYYSLPDLIKGLDEDYRSDDMVLDILLNTEDNTEYLDAKEVLDDHKRAAIIAKAKEVVELYRSSYPDTTYLSICLTDGELHINDNYYDRDGKDGKGNEVKESFGSYHGEI